MSQVEFVAQADKEHLATWLKAPQSCDLLVDGIGGGPTRKEIAAESDWFHKLKLELNEFQTLGKGGVVYREWFTPLNHLWTFKIDIGDMKVTVIRFVDLNHRHA